MTLDEPKRVRDEDAFDVEAVRDWLAPHLGGQTETPLVRQFSGGASNLTYLLRYPDQDLILRRPPAGTKAKSAHDMGREHLIQSRLKPVFPYVPDMVAMCADESVIGSEFYVMRRLPGVILRRDLPSGVSLSREQAVGLCRNVLDRLADLHSVDPAAAGLAEIGRGDGYVGRQVAGWSDRFRRARTRNVPSYERVMAWLAANQPADVRSCVIHNDYRFDNVVLDPDRPWHEPGAIQGILDWEMATVGDPLMDLGGALAYWIEAGEGPLANALRMQPTHLPGMLTRQEVVEYYCDRMGLPTENWPFYQVFGLFRLAVIVQQIYYRYHHRQTRNPKFRFYWVASHWLHHRARQVIKQSRR
ncbi:phosphotransferase family protein [Actinokineospora iranica]|uniref:Predicted kinase, aminoglycoside phosphotransferase (APT) family n=1 Tax=Actinokineospora iranica TaxID=1271860 RepID=A0A1G6TMA2_9PSEU|nr:phosphotransferase family protein [Actinokineospora iranica]SDD29455.1 Predicted kinase, aminoglycoside phosphotransferase (APT) family [Actinokineospora iranica]